MPAGLSKARRQWETREPEKAWKLLKHPAIHKLYVLLISISSSHDKHECTNNMNTNPSNNLQIGRSGL